MKSYACNSTSVLLSIILSIEILVLYDYFDTENVINVVD